MTDSPPVSPVTSYAAGTDSQVLQAQRLSSLERIVVSAGLPMGPPGVAGPTGPTGPIGTSSRWTVEGLSGASPPAVPPTRPDGSTDAVFDPGEAWLDTDTGNVWVYQLYNGTLQWVLEGNMFGPTGPVGPTGPRPVFGIDEVRPGGFNEANVTVNPVIGTPGSWLFDFVVPSGATGPVGPAPIVEIGDVVSVGPSTGPWVTTAQSGGLVTFNFGLQQGPTGPAGTNIKIVGKLPAAGPPTTATAPNPQDGDGWVDVNDHVWVWSATAGEWIDVGPVVGPAGATGPTGPGAQRFQFELELQNAGAGTATQKITHSMQHHFPVVRVFLEVGSGMYTDAVGVQVFYTPGAVEIAMDSSIFVNGAQSVTGIVQLMG